MADKASKFDPKEIADVAQNTLRKFTSLDTPQDMTAAETAADIAAGFVPGIGTAQSARDFERARREGDKLGMGLSAVGMVPVVGGVVKPAKVAAKSLGDLVDQYVRRVRKMEELGPAGYSVHKVEAPASSEVPGWHISQDLPGILSTGAMTNKAVGANNIQGWVPAHVGGAYFYSDPRLARAKWEDLADVVGDPKLAAEMPVIRAQLRRGNRLVPDEDVSLSVPWQQSYQEGSFATKRPVLINQIDRIYSADPSVTKDMIRDTIIRQRRYAAGGAVADTDVKSWLAANPGATDVDIAAAMQRYNIAPEQVSRVTNVNTPQVEQRYAAAVAPNALVTQAYRDILQRDPEQEGLQYWTNQLSTNKLTPESLYQNIAASAQSADAPNAQRYANALQNRNLVMQAYRDILQRAPEQEGLSYWTGQLNTGALTPETLRQNILASAQGADASKAQQYAQNFAATQPDRPKHGDVAPKNAADPSSVSNPYSTRKTLDDLASIYSIGTYFIPGMQFAAPIDYALRALSLSNTIKNIGKKLGFAAGGPVNYDPTEIDTIVSRVKEELHG